MKKWFTSKTIITFGAAFVVAGALLIETLLELELGTDIEPEVLAPIVVAAAWAIVLRFLTSQGIEL